MAKKADPFEFKCRLLPFKQVFSSSLLTSLTFVLTLMSFRTVMLDSPINEFGNICSTQFAKFSIFSTHSPTVSFGILFVPACIMTCDGLGSVDIEFISDLISSAFLPGNVRLTTLLFDIFLGVYIFNN